jgi:hypothetical protein
MPSDSLASVHRHRAAKRLGLVLAPRGFIHPDDLPFVAAAVDRGNIAIMAAKRGDKDGE